jgi:hypothetical protein
MAEWKKWTIADAGTIKDIADQAKKLAEGLKTASDLAVTAATVTKWIAELESINPFIKALELIADELIKAIQDTRNAGYYYLLVDPYSGRPNVTPTNTKVKGFEQCRNSSGSRLYWNPNSENPEATITTIVPGSGDPKMEPKLTIPRKIVVGGYNPYVDQMIDPFNTMTPYPTYSAKKVVETIVEAFQDEGDVAKYKAKDGEFKHGKPDTGDIVFNDEGVAFTGWDRDIKFGLQLWNMGAMKADGTDHDIPARKDGGWKSDREEINIKIQSGRPNAQGSSVEIEKITYGGNTLKIETGSSALVFIIAAPSYKVFAESMQAFAKLFSDIPDFKDESVQNIMDHYNDIFVTPKAQVINMTMCDSKYGLFAVGDVIRGERGGLGQITKVDKVVVTSMVAMMNYTLTDDLGNVELKYEEVDSNSSGRYKDMEITLTPIATAEASNIESWVINDAVYEQQARGTWGSAAENYPNYQIKGQDTMTYPGDRTRSGEKRKLRGEITKRIYPKYGTVALEKLEIPLDSVSPDFSGIQMSQCIPMWNTFFDLLENFVVGVKGYISTPTQFIQDQIDMLKRVVKELEDMIKTIEKFLKFFSIDLSKMGIYAIHVKGNTGGNAGLASAISNADGLPTGLDYAAGIVFVGMDVGGQNLLDLTLAKLIMPNASSTGLQVTDSNANNTLMEL